MVYSKGFRWKWALWLIVYLFSLQVEVQAQTTTQRGEQTLAIDELEMLKSDLVFIQVNDMGRNGYYLQKPIAELLGSVAEIVGPDAIIAAGDTHHFMGVQSTMDPLWWSNFEEIYSHPELMVPWLPILGNHEYVGNTQAVIDYSNISRRWQMEGRYYSKVFESKKCKVKLILIDTTPLIERYRKESDKYKDVLLVEPDAELKWLERELSEEATWKIVIGHHPIYADTNKAKSEQEDLRSKVAPLLREYNADAYTAGHIHNFQHFREKESNIDYIVNSSPSLSRKEVKRIEGSLFADGGEGFMIISADKEQLTFSMIDKDGKIIYQIHRKKEINK